MATDGDLEARGAGDVTASGIRFAVELTIDGRRLPLKQFLHDMIGGAVEGLVSGLRDGGAARSIRIDVTRQ